MKTNKKLINNLVLLSSLLGGQFACANMLSPFTTDARTLGFQFNKSESMYLGQWKNQIANKINPVFYSNLDNSLASARFPTALISPNYTMTEKRFIVPVFADNFSLDQFSNKGLYFTFSSKSQTLTPFALGQMFNDASNINLNTFFKKTTQLVGQEFYTPNYVISNGNSTLGIGAVLVQQRFLDGSIGNTIFASSSTFQPYNDKAFISTNRGTGYQLSFTQQLPANIHFAIDYRSKIEMNEFDSFGSSYSEPGDFDIPSQYTFSLSVPFLDRYKLNLSSQNITYSESKTVVHSGYSQSFLRAFSNPIRKIFLLKDLTVYSIGLEQQLSESMSWQASVVSRQQAPATAEIYNTILENDTAAYSYRLGFSRAASFGEFNFYASFANKPLLIGGTEFGRITSTELTRHIEGVASWSFSF